VAETSAYCCSEQLFKDSMKTDSEIKAQLFHVFYVCLDIKKIHTVHSAERKIPQYSTA
jgi:hypothetical protein